MEVAAIIAITIIVVVAITSIHLRGRHRHVWKVIDKDEQLSPQDELLRAGVSTSGVKVPGHAVHEFLHKPVIVTRRCETCGNEEVRRV